MVFLMVWMQWDQSFPKSLSSNHTVIVFDSRGIGNTTMGSKSYSMQQLANDTAGLMDALKIPRADVFGIFYWIIYCPTVYNDISR